MTEEEKRKYQPPPTLGNKPEPREDRELKRKILSSKYKQLGNIDGEYTGEETMNWLIKMEDETIIPGALMLDGSQFSMPILMDSLFDKLERYTFEVNKRNKIRIGCQRPDGFKEKVDHFHRRKVSYIRAHMSSDLFSMVFNATDNAIDVFIIPTDRLVGFDPYETDFEPHVRIDKLSVQESSSWGIERKKLTEDDYSKLCRRLIGQLIKVIEGNAKASDKFTFSTSGGDNDEPVIVDRSFEDYLEREDGFHVGEQLPTAQQPSYLESRKPETVRNETDGSKSPESDNTSSQTTQPYRRKIDRTKFSAMFETPDLSKLESVEAEKKASMKTADSGSDSIPEQSGEWQQAGDGKPEPGFERRQAQAAPAASAPSSPGSPASAAPSSGSAPSSSPGSPASAPPSSGSAVPSSPGASASAPSFPGRPGVQGPSSDTGTIRSSDHTASPSVSPPLKPGPLPAPARVPPPVMPARPAPSPEQLPTESQQMRLRDSILQLTSPGPASGNSSRAADKGQNPFSQRAMDNAPANNTVSGAAELSKQVDDAQQTVVDACNVIVSGIDDALESLHETGVTAMKCDNLETVTAVMIQSKRLKSIRDRLTSVIEDVSRI